MGIYPASIVKSMAGRDRGKFFVVVEKIDDMYVSICDGDIHRIDKPKKKKLKHLKPMGGQIDFIKEKLDLGNKITNSDLRKSLSTSLSELGLLNHQVEEGI